MLKPPWCPIAFTALLLAAAPAMAQPTTSTGQGLVMLDYKVVPVPGDESIDLMGFHFLNRMNDWLYLGIGGYAPLFKGGYGGFMALDVTAHAQRRIYGRWFADGGVSLGGGGGGKSIEQSKILSGTGGFFKTYVGLGYEFDAVSVGVNVSRFRFIRSAIDHTQLNVFAQVPFSYPVGSYADAGQAYSGTAPADGTGAGENMLSLGLDNYFQRNPVGINKGTIGAADLQFSHFMTRDSYWFVNAGVGWRGLRLYNQVLGGVGARWPVAPNLNVYGQVGVGSGGYAPETIDTGPGLLVFPKVTAEYMLSPNFGLAVSAGYLFAPKASSKNLTLGASLNYHLRSVGGGAAAGSDAGGATFRGYRVNLFPQTEFRVRDRGTAYGQIKMVSVQLDSSVSHHVYIPVQVSVAYNAYLGYPGYGELLAGVGLQTRHDPGSRVQWFGQVLAGANSRGTIVKYGLGASVSVSDQLALYGVAGQTAALRRQEFSADYVGLGLSYRFSVPSR